MKKSIILKSNMNQDEVLAMLENNVSVKPRYKQTDDMYFVGKRVINKFIIRPGNQNCFFVEVVVLPNEDRGSVVEVTFYYLVTYYILVLMTMMFLGMFIVSFVNGALNIGSLAVGSMMIIFLFVTEIYKYHCVSKIIRLTKSFRQ